MRQVHYDEGKTGTYWQLLEMPVPVVLTLLWLLGIVLLATCAMALYSLVAAVFGA